MFDKSRLQYILFFFVAGFVVHKKTWLNVYSGIGMKTYADKKKIYPIFEI